MNENWWLARAGVILRAALVCTRIAPPAAHMFSFSLASSRGIQHINSGRIHYSSLLWANFLLFSPSPDPCPVTESLELVCFGACSAVQQTLLPAHCFLCVCLEKFGLGICRLSMGILFLIYHSNLLFPSLIQSKTSSCWVKTGPRCCNCLLSTTFQDILFSMGKGV